jgi:hypothetical protein
MAGRSTPWRGPTEQNLPETDSRKRRARMMMQRARTSVRVRVDETRVPVGPPAPPSTGCDGPAPAQAVHPTMHQEPLIDGTRCVTRSWAAGDAKSRKPLTGPTLEELHRWLGRDPSDSGLRRLHRPWMRVGSTSSPDQIERQFDAPASWAWGRGPYRWHKASRFIDGQLGIPRPSCCPGRHRT